ncbi:MAG: NIPSNAP family protein [Flavisolibacter sp.]
MHKVSRLIKIFLSGFLFLSVQSGFATPKTDFYQIRIYHLKTMEQMQMMDTYLKDALLPALHRAGIKRVGVFKPLANDTAELKAIYVWIPFSSEKSFFKLDKELQKDDAYMRASKPFREAASTQPPYDRIESILLEAFEGQKHFIAAEKKPGTIFEYRSYESPTEDLHRKKMMMFNKEEITLFKKLDFNIVFFAKVLSGSRMPNFIYMPSFTSVDERNKHWQTFGADPTWKAMQANPEYENKVSVSRIESVLMAATEYSDL